MQMQYTELLHQHQLNWKSSGMILPLYTAQPSEAFYIFF